MAARDNVLFHASVASGLADGTVIPLSIQYGIENVRQGYGMPVLKNVRAFYVGVFSQSGSLAGIPVEIKNSKWIDNAGLVAQNFLNETAINRDSLAFMRGRDKVLEPNTAWTVNAILSAASTAAGDLYVLFEIEYADVPGRSTDLLKGSPVVKTCTNPSVSGVANAVVPLGSFDNLLQNVTYVLSEASIAATGSASSANFLIIEGFGTQKGLIRIIPIKYSGLADPIDGSVDLTKQTYNLSMIRSAATSGAVTIRMEMVASTN